MSQLLKLFTQIRQAERIIGEGESVLKNTPDDVKLFISLKAVYKIKQKLEIAIKPLLAASRLAQCRYEIVTDKSTVSAETFAKSILEFQKIIGVTYDNLKHPKQKTARLTSESSENTKMNFGYCFEGAAGVILTVPEELIQETSDLEPAVEKVGQLLNCTDSDQMHEYSQEMGHVPIRSLSEWSEIHWKSDTGSKIDWRFSNQKTQTVIKSTNDWYKLHRIIANVSDIKTEEIEITGTLVMVNMHTSRFAIDTDKNGTITGTFDGAINAKHEASIPKRYKADLRKTTEVNFAMSKNKETYELIRLKPE